MRNPATSILLGSLMTAMAFGSVLAQDVPGIPTCAETTLVGPGVCGPADGARASAEETAANTADEAAKATGEALATSEANAREGLLATPYRVWTSINDGAGSGLDADTLDGLTSAYFLDAIAAEALARKSGDDAQEAARVAADAALANRAAALEGRAATLEGRAATLEARAGAVESRASALEGIVNRGNVRLDQRNERPGAPTGDRYLRILEMDSVLAFATVRLQYQGSRDGTLDFRIGIHGEYGPRDDSFTLDSIRYYGDPVVTHARVVKLNVGDYGFDVRIADGVDPGLVKITLRESLATNIASVVAYSRPANYVVWVSDLQSSVWTVGAGDGRSLRLNENGDLSAAGHIHAHGNAHVGDIAEPVVGPGLAPGDVVVMNGFTPLGKLQVDVSRAPYSPKVVGIVSTNPSLTLAGLATDTPLAVVGIVPVKVAGAVAEGALLTTSAVPGHAMACDDSARCHGAILGKALEAFHGPGSGTVRVLISLG